jgi:hypothetical protein
MPNLNINGRNMSVEAAPDTPLLWAIREQLQMTGTKFGCGAGLCGACSSASHSFHCFEPGGLLSRASRQAETVSV